MNTQNLRITKEDVELIALGLNEYINYYGKNKNSDEKKHIDEMLNRIDRYLKDKI